MRGNARLLHLYCDGLRHLHQEVRRGLEAEGRKRSASQWLDGLQLSEILHVPVFIEGGEEALHIFAQQVIRRGQPQL